MCSGKPRNGERGPAHAPTSLPAKTTVSVILLAYAVRPPTEQLSNLFLSSSTSTRLLADCFSHRLVAELCALGSHEMVRKDAQGIHPFRIPLQDSDGWIEDNISTNRTYRERTEDGGIEDEQRMNRG